jgi:hypothetical protein
MWPVRSPEARREVSLAESYLLQFLQLPTQQFPHRSHADAFIATAATFLNGYATVASDTDLFAAGI